MRCYTGIDVSLEVSHFCVVDAAGKVVKEARVASEPEAILADSDDHAHVFRSDAAQRSKLIARRLNT